MAEISTLEKYCGVGLKYVTSLLGTDGTLKGNVVQLVKSPYDTPAKKAGIGDNDVILAVDMLNDGHWMKTSYPADHGFFIGTPGTEVGIRFFHQETKQVREVSVTRDYIVPIYGKDTPIPVLAPTDISRIPLSPNAECEWHLSSDGHGLGGIGQSGQKNTARG